jgi:hypothetical protein
MPPKHISIETRFAKPSKEELADPYLTHISTKAAAQTDHRSNREEFFEHAKKLAALYTITNFDEQGKIAEICTSNRKWDGEKLYIEPEKRLEVTLTEQGDQGSSPEVGHFSIKTESQLDYKNRERSCENFLACGELDERFAVQRNDFNLFVNIAR